MQKVYFMSLKFMECQSFTRMDTHAYTHVCNVMCDVVECRFNGMLVCDEPKVNDAVSISKSSDTTLLNKKDKSLDELITTSIIKETLQSHDDPNFIEGIIGKSMRSPCFSYTLPSDKESELSGNVADVEAVSDKTSAQVLNGKTIKEEVMKFVVDQIRSK